MPTKTPDQLREEAADLLKQAELLDNRSRGIAAASGEARVRLVAELLHEHCCHFSHTDQCDWHYHKQWPAIRDQSPTSTHSLYHRRAQKVIAALEKAGVKQDKQEALLVAVLDPKEMR